jgi:hypothetical protein
VLQSISLTFLGDASRWRLTSVPAKVASYNLIALPKCSHFRLPFLHAVLENVTEKDFQGVAFALGEYRLTFRTIPAACPGETVYPDSSASILKSGHVRYLGSFQLEREIGSTPSILLALGLPRAAALRLYLAEPTEMYSNVRGIPLTLCNKPSPQSHPTQECKWGHGRQN